ncbi:MAG: hypothetical protein ACYC8W_03360 [Candidatus Tyrphobacter sp.]
MDVKDLAPALLALGVLCDEANSLLNGSSAKVSLEVKADFKRGSFDVFFHLVVSQLGHLTSFLMGKPKDAKEVLELLGFYGTLVTGVVKGVTKLAKRIGRNKVTATTSLADGTTKIVLENNITIIVENNTWDLYRRQNVARALGDVVRPLEEEGVTEFRVLRGDQEQERIGKDDLPAFQGIPANLNDDSIVNESVNERVFEVVGCNKNPEHIWRFSDGTNVVTAHIEDQEFFKHIEQGNEVVSLGDILRVEVRTTTTREGGKLRTVTTVTKVIEHIPIRRVDPPMLNFS